MDYTDLKLIDELVCEVKAWSHRDWDQLPEISSIMEYAMKRLRKAWNSGEMPKITAGLADYFRRTN